MVSDKYVSNEWCHSPVHRIILMQHLYLTERGFKAAAHFTIKPRRQQLHNSSFICALWQPVQSRSTEPALRHMIWVTFKTLWLAPGIFAKIKLLELNHFCRTWLELVKIASRVDSMNHWLESCDHCIYLTHLAREKRTTHTSRLLSYAGKNYRRVIQSVLLTFFCCW